MTRKRVFSNFQTEQNRWFTVDLDIQTGKMILQLKFPDKDLVNLSVDTEGVLMCPIFGTSVFNGNKGVGFYNSLLTREANVKVLKFIYDGYLYRVPMMWVRDHSMFMETNRSLSSMFYLQIPLLNDFIVKKVK